MNTDNNRGSDDDEDWIEEFGREEFKNDEDDEDDEDDEERLR